MGPEVVPRPASTVMLVRDGRAHDGAALEVFVLHRVAGMEFAPSVTVFPGGGVDPSDGDDVPWVGPDAAWWGTALGVGDDRAAALVVAAVRELFEETGVLLADGHLGERDRAALVDRHVTIAELLTAQGLSLRSDLLRPWANWVTPPGGTRRYDTFFFVAQLPAGQSARMLTTEAESGRWAGPAELLAAHHAGSLAMMQPTVAMLTDLADAGSVTALMNSSRQIVTVRASPASLRAADLPAADLPAADLPAADLPAAAVAPPAGGVRVVAAGVGVLLADNAGPMTLDGTNSYLLPGSAADSVVVVDPGPDDEAHLQALAAHGRVELILITHRHADHTAGAPRLAELTGAPVRAADPAHCRGGEPLVDGEEIDAAGRRLRVLATPGHTSDSVCFHLLDPAGPGAVLTGDTILGRGSTVLVHPDGNLRSYLQSLDRLADLGAAWVLPGHGPQLPDLAAVATQYAEHRHQRLDSVRAALLVLGRDATAARVADLVYAGVDAAVRPAAELSVEAQLEYLRGPD